MNPGNTIVPSDYNLQSKRRPLRPDLSASLPLLLGDAPYFL
jgi:hypothetical protein